MRLSWAFRREISVLPGWGALVCTLITAPTIQGMPKTAATALRGHDPGAIEPGWSVADMLLVSTCQVCHPILRFILMKTGHRVLHGHLVGS